jgi:hypothetical protein
MRSLWKRQKSCSLRLEKWLYTMYNSRNTKREAIFCSFPCRTSFRCRILPLLDDAVALPSDLASSVEGAQEPASATAADSLRAVQDRLSVLQQQINRLQRSVRLAIEAEFAGWSGRNYGSLKANQGVAQMIQQTVDGHGLRLRCPECGHPAILRCSSRPGVPDGVFVFDHTIEGRRTFHGGGSTLPALRVVSKPPRQRKADA